MAVKIRLARGGSKKRPHYSIVAADTRMARDGRYLEKLGTYNPLLPKDDENRVKMDVDRVMEFIADGAKPTDRVRRFLEAGGQMEKIERKNMQKATPGAKEAARAEERTKRVEATKAAEVEAAAKPAEEPAAEEAPAEGAAEGAAEETKA